MVDTSAFDGGDVSVLLEDNTRSFINSPLNEDNTRSFVNSTSMLEDPLEHSTRSYTHNESVLTHNDSVYMHLK